MRSQTLTCVGISTIRNFEGADLSSSIFRLSQNCQLMLMLISMLRSSSNSRRTILWTKQDGYNTPDEPLLLTRRVYTTPSLLKHLTLCPQAIPQTKRCLSRHPKQAKSIDTRGSFMSLWRATSQGLSH